MKALLIPVAVLAFALPSAAAQDEAEADQPERVLATELPTRRQAVAEIISVLGSWSYLAASRPSVEVDAGGSVSHADNRLPVITSALDRISEEDWPVVQPIVEAALPLASRTDGHVRIGANIQFAILLARHGQNAEALAILHPVRDALIAPRDDIPPQTVAALWLTLANAYAYCGDASLMSDAISRGIALRQSALASMFVEMTRVRALADAGYPTEAYRLLARLLYTTSNETESLVAAMGPTMVMRTLAQIGDPAGEAIVYQIVDRHVGPASRGDALVSLSETAAEAGNRQQALRYADAALRTLLAEEPPYRQVPLFERVRTVAARLGRCDLAHAIGELVSVARQLDNVIGFEPQTDLFRTNGQLYGPQSAELLECHQAGDAVRFILDHAQEREEIVNGMLADIPEGQGVHRSIIRSIGRTSREFVVLYHRASSDVVRDRLAEAVSRIIPPEDIVAPLGAAPAIFGDDPEFMVIWISGALAAGRRHDAEQVMLAYYNRLPEAPAPRVRGLIELLPHLSSR